MKELQRKRRQLSARLVPELVRDVLDRFVRGELTCSEAMDSLEVKRSRLYTLRTEFLKAKASGEGASWAPRLSGGNHYEAWPDEVLHFLHKALKQEPKPFSYAFATSEVERRFQFTLSRSQAHDLPLGTRVCLCCYTDDTHTVIPHEPRQLTTPPDILGTTRSLPVYHLN